MCSVCAVLKYTVYAKYAVYCMQSPVEVVPVVKKSLETLDVVLVESMNLSVFAFMELEHLERRALKMLYHAVYPLSLDFLPSRKI